MFRVQGLGQFLGQEDGQRNGNDLGRGLMEGRKVKGIEGHNVGCVVIFEMKDRFGTMVNCAFGSGFKVWGVKSLTNISGLL